MQKLQGLKVLIGGALVLVWWGLDKCWDNFNRHLQYEKLVGLEILKKPVVNDFKHLYYIRMMHVFILLRFYHVQVDLLSQSCIALIQMDSKNMRKNWFKHPHIKRNYVHSTLVYLITRDAIRFVFNGPHKNHLTGGYI